MRRRGRHGLGAMPTTPDRITISQLELSTFIGVTEDERSRPQQLRVTMVLEPSGGVARLGDRLENAVDYATVSESVKALALKGRRSLIETLAEEIAAHLLANY